VADRCTQSDLESGAELLRRLATADLTYPGIVFIVSMLLYSWTLAPTVTLVDSGELIVAAHCLGVAHPPGFPLYIVLAHVASLVPVGNIARRVHFASALFAGLAAAVVTLVIAELLIAQSYVETKRKTKREMKGDYAKKFSAPASSSFLALAPALTGGLLIAFSRTLWSYATVAEVYTLNTILIAIIFWLMARWRRKILEDKRAIGQHQLIYVAAGVFGLALGVHHVTIGLMLPALALLVWATQGPKFFASRRLFYAAGAAFAMLVIVYSYLPIAASRSPIINWGNPRSIQAIWAHITGKQYQVFLSFDSKIIGQQLIEFGKLLFREFGPWWFPIVPGLTVAGFVRLFKSDRVTFWFLGLLVITDLAYGVGYVIAEDKDAYYLPAFIAFAIAAAFGLRWLLCLSVFQRKSLTTLPLITVALVGIVPTVALASNWPFNNRRHYYIAHDYLENILGSTEAGSLLLTLDWQVASPMFYAREIEHLRPDVKIVDVNLLRRSWYFDYLSHAYPELLERSRDKVDSFIAELKRWDNDPTAYANDATLTQTIASKFQDMIISFVKKEREVAPVYVTNDLVFQTEQQDKELTQWLTKQYQFVPQGLIFKLEEGRSFHDPGPLHLETRGLGDGTLRFEPDDVVNLKVFPAYKTMLVNRGRYFSFFNQPERATEAFTNALALDPKLETARQGLRDSMEKLRNSQRSLPETNH
jgi:hypothetical protein